MQLGSYFLTCVLFKILISLILLQKLLDQTPENRIIYVDVEDIVGNRWNLKLRWWSTKNGRRYIFDGTRKCCQKMQWNAGDTCKESILYLNCASHFTYNLI